MSERAAALAPWPAMRGGWPSSLNGNRAASAKRYRRPGNLRDRTHRRDVLCEGLSRLGWEAPRPRASMFVWAKIPKLWADRMNSIDFAMKLLKEGDVAVSPGGGFGPAGEGYLRLALVENENRLRQAVRQIGRCLKKSS